jgi:FtsH-binding integral membrane protein
MATAPERKYAVDASAQDVAIDVGLRQYMLRVYNYMAGGLVVTGVVAFAVASSPGALRAIYGTPLAWVVMFSPVIFALLFGFRINAMKASTAQALFWAFSAVMGLSMASIFLRYTGSDIARVFFITAGTFGATSLYGYTTRRDLTGVGSFMMMGLFGIIIASIVNLLIFPTSTDLPMIISIVGVIVFTGLTAYDTQRIKESYVEGDSHDIGIKKAVIGAFQLYLDFINLFLMLLRLLGSRN